MAFNGQGTILAAGCNSDIKLWKFNNGKMNEQNKLTGHTGTVNCIVFSKTNNWFASGSADCTIRSWKE
jgi:WD40 repeat protein